ncbi:positive regulator of purine utilization [Purpureocillium lavendulum]|uniref:Carboxylic ester hydrolase n=1 Tax=Purpureocillium lavendulum TaxID=1247861 RepID=A0AB34G0I9_9HYPO|nr:positive regulator of purine utilization [Purpureocillium lavendulum]
MTRLSLAVAFGLLVRHCHGRELDDAKLRCSNLPAPRIAGAKVLSITSELKLNYAPLGNNTKPLDLCEVNVTLEHAGAGDKVLVQTWLPLGTWNQRYVAIGGGAWLAGTLGPSLAQPVSEGYAASSTDGGLGADPLDPASWALKKDGSINWDLLTNFASRSIHDMAIVGKAVTAAFYARPAKFAYWNGCSTGGIQGLVAAQKYPKDFDGVLAGSPAIYWTEYVIAELWPQVVMRAEGYFPTQCEQDAVIQAAVAACDELDQVKDGVINQPERCHFDPFTAVGSKHTCGNVSVVVTKKTASIIKKIWEGPKGFRGHRLWYGLPIGASTFALAETEDVNGTYTGKPLFLPDTWIRYFVKQNPEFNVASVDAKSLVSLFWESKEKFNSLIGSADPDLRPFKKSGGKLMVWHGLADQLIFPQDTVQYYKEVEHVLGGAKTTSDFFRLFLAPGVDHCGFGPTNPGAVPSSPFSDLVAWVEKGKAPENIQAETPPGAPSQFTRKICRYPMVARYQGWGSKDSSDSYNVYLDKDLHFVYHILIKNSYVFYLESRVEQLEKILISHDISFPSSENLDLLCSASRDSKERADPAVENAERAGDRTVRASDSALISRGGTRSSSELSEFSLPKSGWLASVSGVSFSSLVFTALQQDGAAGNANDISCRKGMGTGNDTSRKLVHLPNSRRSLPPKAVGLKLATLYFEHVNPHIPILHRGDLLNMLHAVYEADGSGATARQLYIINMVFAMGCDVMDTVVDSQPPKPNRNEAKVSLPEDETTRHSPEDYYLEAIVHLESCLTGTGGGLEVLQAILMLANFALLRPVPPGLRYITGVAVCLAIDLGLHQEDCDETDEVDTATSDNKGIQRQHADKPARQEQGKAQWNRDLRRRLWWCTYTFDRLVSTCVGRPFGINEHAITTELPSLLDDDHITTSGFIEPPHADGPSYKHASHHHFRLHLLQSEIVQVLQFNQGKVARAAKKRRNNPTQTNTPCPFIAHFDSFGSWLVDMEKRLHLWRASTPTAEETGVAYSTLFLELGYWQAVILLHGKRGSTPALKKALHRAQSGSKRADCEDDTDQSHIKVAEAGQKVIRLYRQLHLQGLIRYTYISTHQLFVAGMSYLEAIHASHALRGKTLDEVDFTVLAAKSVFADMVGKCPQASAYLDVFDQMARATIKLLAMSMDAPVSSNGYLVEEGKNAGIDPFWGDAFSDGGVLDTFDALFFGS